MKLRIKNLITIVLCLLAMTDAALAVSTFVVTNTNDSGAGSLRQAILDANAAPNSGGPDLINFAIGGAGPHTISPTSGLPTITDPVIIDGFTQPGSTSNTNATGGLNTVLQIELDGTGAGSSNGLTITAGGSTVRGLVINRFTQQGIYLQATGGNVIEGNFLGTNVTGTAVLQNGNSGVYMDSPNNVIGGTTPGARNLSSGNFFHCVEINGSGATGNQVQGNLLGTNAAGTASLSGTTSFGIFITAGANTNTIGGTTPAARNVVSGNVLTGVTLRDTFGNQIQGNYIGTDASGTAPLGNATGVNLDNSSNNTIGGLVPGARNIISGNNSRGISTVANAATGNLIQGNYIGTNATGTAAIPNQSDGVRIRSASNTIGGTVAGAGNLISGNGTNGVFIGGATAQGNQISGNVIFSNGELGIDLEDDGVTPNDGGDGDPGANNLQNFPILTSANASGGNTTIQGSLNSAANATFRVEFFSNPVCDSSGNGEGQTFLGATSVTTVGNDVTINIVLPVFVVPGHVVTATATDPANNTSEFSACLVVTGTGPSPTPTATPSQLLNISTRMRVQSGENVLIGGFIVTGTDPKQVIIRAIGPSLASFFPDALANPTLELFQDSTLLASNDNWRVPSQNESEVLATGIPPTDDLESALVRTLQPGAYTAIVRGSGGASGIGLVEAYDLAQGANSKLANISTRGFVETDSNVMIGGLIIGPAGGSNATVVVRAIGPSLADFGIPGALQDPALELKDANGTTLISNDDWQQGQPTEIQQAGLAPTDTRESALLATLAPGAYTAIVRGAGNTTGVGLVEVYHLQ